MKKFFIFMILFISVSAVFFQKNFSEETLNLKTSTGFSNEAANINAENEADFPQKIEGDVITSAELSIESRIEQAGRFSEVVIEDVKFKPLNDYFRDISRFKDPYHKAKFSSQDLLKGFLGMNINPKHPEYKNLTHLLDEHDDDSNYGECKSFEPLIYNSESVKAICINRVIYEKSENSDVIHVRGADIKYLLVYDSFKYDFIDYVFSERDEATIGRNLEIEQLFNSDGIRCIENKCLIKRRISKYEENQLINNYPSCHLVIGQGSYETTKRNHPLIEINCLEKDHGRL